MSGPGSLPRAATALLLVATVAVLTVNSPADAAPGTLAGEAPRGDGLVVGFEVAFHHGDPVAVRRFRFRNARATCDGGVRVVVRGTIKRMKVNQDRRFSKTVRRTGRRARVQGRIVKGGSKARGTLRATGRFAGVKGCDSGMIRWAKRLR